MRIILLDLLWFFTRFVAYSCYKVLNALFLYLLKNN